MNVFAQEDLNRKGASSQVSSAVNTAANNTSQVFSISGINFDSILSNLNIFLLAWTIFYTFVCLIDFFEYRVLHNDNIMLKEKKGMRGIYRAMRISRNYLIFWIFYLLYGIFGASNTVFQLPLALLVILAFILKILVDLRDILDLIEWQPFGKGVSKLLRKIISFGK